MSKQIDDRELLEALILDPEFERLERAVGRFNIFEAVGVVRQELRHSDFLAFLLDPQQAHCLSDWFLKRLLRRTLLASRGAAPSVGIVDLDCWSLEDTQVLREWSNIDILLLNHRLRVAVVIENKVGSEEHSDQLRRYHATVEETYPEWRFLGLYLTPKGELPTHRAYLPISYQAVVDVIQELLDSHSASLDQDLRSLMVHYIEMVRRNVLNRSEIDDLCVRIYQRHRRALDLIFERRLGQQTSIREILEGLIEDDPDVLFDFSNTRWVAFVWRGWDTPPLRTGTYSRFGTEKRVLLFWFENTAAGLNLQLQVSPCPTALGDAILRSASDAPAPIRVTRLPGAWVQVYRDQWLTEAELQQLGAEQLRDLLTERWRRFREGDLTRIVQVFEQQPWLQTAPDALGNASQL